jgi:hypothetical protein
MRFYQEENGKKEPLSGPRTPLVPGSKDADLKAINWLNKVRDGWAKGLVFDDRNQSPDCARHASKEVIEESYYNYDHSTMDNLVPGTCNTTQGKQRSNTGQTGLQSTQPPTAGRTPHTTCVKKIQTHLPTVFQHQ